MKRRTHGLRWKNGSGETGQCPAESCRERGCRTGQVEWDKSMKSEFDPIGFARALINIDSTTGREREAGDWLARELGELGYTVVRQPLDRGCANVLATIDP